MQIVIDIPKDTFEKIREFDGEHDVLIDRGKLYEAIQNGTPIPKEHGRLIDADAFKKKVCTYQQTGCGSCKHSLCCPEDAPTIIEADKEDEQ